MAGITEAMRIAIGAVKHESNTFTPLTTPLSDFDVVTGEEVYETRWVEEETATSGIVDTLSEAGHDLVPTRFGKSLPSGIVSAEAYEYLRDGIIDGVREADSLDAVCLDLHGSMCAEIEDDPEGDLVARVRDVVGPDVPLVVSLDMHATVTERFVDGVDGVAAYRTAPHVDVYDSGVRAATLLREILDGTGTVVERVRIPMLLSGEQSETDAPPMNDLIESLRHADETPGVLQSSLLLGFPWADSPHGGCFAVVCGRADAVERVRDTARELASEFWDRREEFDFTTEAYPLEEAIDEALETNERPVVVSDSGDNPTAGATEDLTIVDDRLRDRGVEDALVGVINDPEARRACAEAGEGRDVRVALGRTAHEPDAEPLEICGTVRSLAETHGVAAAAIESGGVTTVVTDGRTAVYDPDLLRAVDCDPVTYDIVVIKSGYQSPAFQDLAARSMLALTPGDTNCILPDLPYENVPRPIYPLDENFTWAPA
jgi:microcystin degradation protein MlrC